MTRKYEGRCVVVRRPDGYHILDLVTKVESGIIPGGYQEALRGARNWENAREESERLVRRAAATEAFKARVNAYRPGSFR